MLIVNPASGGGRAERFDLVGHCRRLGIETVIRERGASLAEMARAAVGDGTEVLGMAGGDGSQAAVAAVAAELGLAYVCVPAGTRNHFALDIGIDRNDVVGALDAFVDGRERRIDLARVNGRTFVNNVSMGMYGRIVQSPEYRDAKLRTVIRNLPELVGPRAEHSILRFTGDDGSQHSHAVVLLVSNNPYLFDPRPGRGTRGTMDSGTLGIVSVTEGPPFQGLREWSTPSFRVGADAAVELGIDGEAAVLQPPLVFETVSSALRIRVPRTAGAARH